MNLRGRKIFLAALALLFLFTVYDLTAQQNVPAAKTFQDKEALAENTYLRQRQRFEKIEPQLAQQSSVKVNKLVNETRNLLSQLQTAHSAGTLETKENQQKLYQLNKNLRMLRTIASQKEKPARAKTTKAETSIAKLEKKESFQAMLPKGLSNEQYINIAESRMPELSGFVQSSGNPRVELYYSRLERRLKVAKIMQNQGLTTRDYDILVDKVRRELLFIEMAKIRAEAKK